MTAKTSNLSEKIFIAYNQDILKTRNALFASIGNNSEKLRNASQDILTSKLKENNYRLWGEVYPWLISDLTGIDKESIRHVTSGWLAIYLHTIFIDTFLDKEVRPKPTELLASSLLAKEGLLNLQKVVIGTKYEKLFEDAFNSAATFELADVINRLDFSSMEDKEAVAIGKNRIILACAGALAAINEPQARTIIEFTNSLLLTIQFLDDLRDIEEDYLDKNFSYPLSFAFRNEINLDKKLTKKQILGILIESNALSNTIGKIKICLSQSIQILQNINSNIVKDSEGYLYFINLLSEIISLDCYLQQNKEYFNKSNKEEKGKILDELESRIYRCDISS